jgi:hypothetical protein
MAVEAIAGEVQDNDDHDKGDDRQRQAGEREELVAPTRGA